MRFKVVALLLVSALLVPVSATLSAAERVALRVVVVKTDNPDAYVKEIEKGKALLKRIGSGVQLRVWRAQFAGENAGAIVVAAEYPNLAALAKDYAAVSADAEYQAWLKGLDKIRTIVSDSLYEELKP
jgi:hypothetical protein